MILIIGSGLSNSRVKSDFGFLGDFIFGESVTGSGLLQEETCWH